MAHKQPKRIELLDFNIAEELEIAIKIVGKSLKQCGPPLPKVTISDETKEGREKIKSLLEQGWQIVSVRD